MPQPTATRNGSGSREDPQHAVEMVVRASRDLRKAHTQPSDFSEVGTTGLRQYGGFVVEEWLRQLSGRRAAWAFREIMDNSPVVGAILFAIEWLARGAEWRVEPGNDAGTAEFVESCMDDMSHTWGDFISEALSMLPYGWAYHEIVYKRRQGQQASRPAPTAATVGLTADTTENDSNLASSKHKDGKIGWRKLPVRAQETLLRWHFDGYSGIQAMEQIDYHGGDHTIPIEKSLLFRSRARRNNPEGYSILRNAYVPYFRLKNIETIEATGIERDLAGIPMATPPDGVDLNAPSNAQLLLKVQEMVASVRRDEYEGLVMPQAGWKFELVNSGGSRQIDTDAVIRRYEQRIATSMLADFILIGQDAVGSFAMVDVKADLFGMAIDGILDLQCDVLNRYAIPRLLALNGMDTSEPPKIQHSSAGRIDLQKVGEFLQALTLAGADIPWTDDDNALLKALFSEAGLPANFEEHPDEPAEPGAKAPPASTADQLASERAIAAQARAASEAEAQPLQKSDTHTGAMVALYPATDVAGQLSQPGGEPAGDLHLTLAFLGPASQIEDTDKLCRAVSGFATSCPPLQGEVSGIGHFTAGPAPVTYASADVPGLPEHRQRLVDTLAGAGAPPSSEHGFTPHVALAYDHRDPQVQNHPLRFDHVTLKIGPKRYHFPLEGVKKAEPTPSDVHIDSYGSEPADPKRKKRRRRVEDLVDSVRDAAQS